MNDLLKFWAPSSIVREKLKEIHWYTEKIDSYTMFEYLTWVISEERFNELVEEYLPTKKKPYTPIKKSEVVDTTWRVNPEKMCVFTGTSPWDRCIYCNSIRKYIKWKECPKFNAETPGSTVPENEIRDVEMSE